MAAKKIKFAISPIVPNSKKKKNEIYRPVQTCNY